MQKNPIVFWELASNDMEKSASFFGEVFEWEIEMNERLGFFIAPKTTPEDEMLDGGIFTISKAKLPFVALYIQVEDILMMADRIEKNGGMIVEAPFETSGGAQICLFNEPSGVTFALIQTKKS